jgi:hypothetical protein
MKDIITAKLNEPAIKNHIREYSFIEERDVMFHTPTGREHLYIKFYEKTPVGEVVRVIDYFETVHNMKASDIKYPCYTILRVEVKGFTHQRTQKEKRDRS